MYSGGRRKVFGALKKGIREGRKVINTGEARKEALSLQGGNSGSKGRKKQN